MAMSRERLAREYVSGWCNWYIECSRVQELPYCMVAIWATRRRQHQENNPLPDPRINVRLV